MTDPTIPLDYIEYDGGSATPVRRPVIAETPWALYLDGRELLTFMCSPTRLHCLALGFLLSEGFIAGLDDVWQLRTHLDEDAVYMLFPEAGIDGVLRMRSCEEAAGSIVVRLRRPAPPRPERRILTSGCGGGVTFDDLRGERPPIVSDLRLGASQICALMADMQANAALYNESRGVHTSALYGAGGERLALAEDVGRHNTLDKLRGECLLAGLSTGDAVLVTTGRISSEMIGKAYKMGVQLVASRTSPTATSVDLARAWGITLVGYVRQRRLRVYAGAERVTSSG
jgi:FdhD protein